MRNAEKTCDVCQEHKPDQQKEPLLSRDVPSLPWFKVAVDIFEYRSHHYLLVADYFSKFPVLKKLTNLTASHVISLLKTIFAKHGIPVTAFTDQGTQFMSEEFNEFARQYRFQVEYSSPRYPKSNDFIEAMVKVIKNIMEKAEESDSDPHLVMLIYLATPMRPGQLSQGELLTQRKYKALLPVHQYLHPSLEISREAQIAQKQAQGEHYNRTARQFQDLQQFQGVRLQFDPKKPVWRKATVIHKPTGSSPRRHKVQTESGARFCRNRRHIRPAVQDQPQGVNQALDNPEPEPGLPKPGPVKHPSSAPADITNQPSLALLPKQCAPDQGPVGIAMSRPRRNIVPPSRLVEEM